MSKDPIADFLKGTIAILGVIEKGAKAAEKNSRKRAKRTNTRTKTQYIKTILLPILNFIFISTFLK